MRRALFPLMGILLFLAACKSSSDIDSMEEAQKYVLATWTYTDPINLGDPTQLVCHWMKWVVKKDGVIVAYTADPVDNSWGKPRMLRYTISTDKFADTGERYYAIHVLDTGDIAILKPDVLVYSTKGLWMGLVSMTRGDRNPFSK